MSRVRTNIQINGRDCWTLFDTGSRNTYIIGDIAKNLHPIRLPLMREIAIGGRVHKINQWCALIARVEGYTVEFDAYVIDQIGNDEEDRNIEVLFGALAMQKWGIRPIPDEERLDMTHYPKGFIEFSVL